MTSQKKNRFAALIAPQCRELLSTENTTPQVLALSDGAKCLMVVGMHDTPLSTKIRTLTAFGQRSDGTIVLDVHYQHARCDDLCARVALDLRQIEAYAEKTKQEEYRPGRMQTREIPGITQLSGKDEGRFKFSTSWIALLLQRIAEIDPALDVVKAVKAGAHLPVYPIAQPYRPHDADELKNLLSDESRHHFDPLVYEYLRVLQGQLA